MSTFLNNLIGHCRDSFYAVDAAEKFKEISESLPNGDISFTKGACTKSGIIRIITEYLLDRSELNAGISQIFQEHTWDPTSFSPTNRLYFDQFGCSFTRLTIPDDAENHLDLIAARIREIKSLSSLVVQIPVTEDRDRNPRECVEFFNEFFDRDHLKFVKFYEDALKGTKIRSLTFERGVTVPELNAASSGKQLVSLAIFNGIFRAKTIRNPANLNKLATANFANLVHLTIASSKLTDNVLNAICTMAVRIQSLRVAKNLLTREVMHPITQLKNLTALDITGMRGLQFDDLMPLQLRPLKELVIRKCFAKSEGELLRVIHEMRLRVLDLSGTALSDHDLKLFWSFARGELHTLRMENCRSYTPRHDDMISPAVARIASLTELNIIGCEVTPLGILSIGTNLRELKRLDWGGWWLTNPQAHFFSPPKKETLVVKPMEENIEAIKRINPALNITTVPLNRYVDADDLDGDDSDF